jgi:hypothetical protein
MSSNENGKKMKLYAIREKMQELKRIYVLVEVKKYGKVPEWIEKIKIAIDTFEKMTWLNVVLDGTAEPIVEAHEREEQFLNFLEHICLCQAIFFLPSCPCEHLIRISQNLNVVCLYGRDIKLRIYILGVQNYIESEIENLKTQGSNPPAGVTQGLFNSNCIRNEIGNLLNRL